MPADPRLVAMLVDRIVNAPQPEISLGPMTRRLSSRPGFNIPIPIPEPPQPALAPTASPAAEAQAPVAGADVPPSAVPGKAVGKNPYSFTSSGSKQGLGWLTSALKKAASMGLRVGENTLYDTVDPVHVEGSFHYQSYPKSTVNRAADISGSAEAMAAFYKWAKKSYGSKLTELFYDPLGGIKYGKEIGAIGNHDDHVHIAF